MNDLEHLLRRISDSIEAGAAFYQIDELGYLTLKPEQANAFFKLMDRRYGRKSTIITTNLDYPK